MTTELVTKTYSRLDSYIDRILTSFQTTGQIIQEYMNAAKEEGITEDEAKAYLKEKIPKSTFYKYLPLEYKDPKKQTRVTHNMEVSGPPVDQKSPEFDTKGMGVAITDDEPPETHPQPESYTPPINPEPEEVTQSVSCPAATDEQNDRLVARIQELEKMVSDLSFQKGADTLPSVPTPPTQQIMILPHSMVLEVYDKRMQCGLNGFMQLKTENNIVTGIEVVNVQ